MGLLIKQHESCKKAPRGIRVGVNLPTVRARKPVDIVQPVLSVVSGDSRPGRAACPVNRDLGHFEITGTIRNIEMMNRKTFSGKPIRSVPEGNSCLSKSGSQSVMPYTTALRAYPGSSLPFKAQSIVKIVSATVGIIAQGIFLAALIATYFKRMNHCNYFNISGENVNVKN